MMATQMVYGSVDEMIDRVAAGRPVRRSALAKHVDSLSGSPFETVTIGTDRHLLKRLGHRIDWLMRALGDGADERPPWVVLMWEYGLLDGLPSELDHTIVAAAWEPETGVAALLLRDEAAAFVPAGGSPIDLARHRRFLDHMAALHTRFWDFTDDIGLSPAVARYRALSPATGERERELGGTDAVPRALAGGWAALAAAAPAAHEVALSLAVDPLPLVTALAETPATLVHGDWKYGNLGSLADGRTVLVDWAWPGRAGPCVDLAWYLAVNCDRLPESKEDAIAVYRAALETRGMSTVGWWDRQLELALLGAFVQLGWSKTGDAAELGWWTRRVVPLARELLR
jgi:hypothetical protein